MAANSQQSPVNWDGGRKSLIFFHGEEKKMVWGWGEMSQLASTPRWKEILCVPRKCAPAQPGQSGGAGGWKAPLGSQYPCMGILLWPWIPLHQDDPWHRWESATKEVAVGKVSMGGASSFTAPIGSGATTSPGVWGYSCCSARHARTHPGGITHQDPLGKCQFSWLLQG